MYGDVKLIYWVFTLTTMLRGWAKFEPRLGSIADHLIEAMFIALIIGANEEKKKGITVNFGVVLLMMLIHDFPEAPFVDLDLAGKSYLNLAIEKFISERWGIKLDQSKEKITVKAIVEQMIIEDLLKETSLEFMLQYYNQFEKRKTIEAEVGSDADKLSSFLKAFHLSLEGSTFCKGKVEEMKDLDKNLYTESAKELFREFQKSNGYDFYKDLFNKRFHMFG